MFFFCLTIKYRGFLQDFPYTNPMNAEPGPPGTGKSTTAAHLICQLLRRQRWGAAVGTLVAVVFFFRDEIWDESDDIDDGLWLLKSATAVCQGEAVDGMLSFKQSLPLDGTSWNPEHDMTRSILDG